MGGIGKINGVLKGTLPTKPWHRWTRNYEAHIWDGSSTREGTSRKGRQIYLGSYEKEEKAARAYNLAALKYRGNTTPTSFLLKTYEKELDDMKTMTQQKFVASLRSRQCCIHNQNQLSEPLHTLPQKFYSRRNMMESMVIQIVDVWSCGVTLYVMLMGAYPFEDPAELRNFKKTIQRILNVQYAISDYVHISPDCHNLISRIFDANPSTEHLLLRHSFEGVEAHRESMQCGDTKEFFYW